jgi:uncharacterized membrane protein
VPRWVRRGAAVGASGEEVAVRRSAEPTGPDPGGANRTGAQLAAAGSVAWGTARLEAFSDGVLAIAITLLVLDIRVPEHEPGQLGAALRGLAPSYLAYAVSFVIIGIMWAQHHGLFRLVVRADQGLLFVNVLLLAGISFLPFPTHVVAEALRDEHTRGDVTAALLLYGGTLTGIALLYNAVWHYIRLRGLLRPGLDPAVATELTRAYLAGPLLYGAAMLLAPLAAAASYAVWVVLALFFLRGVPEPRERPAQT